MNYYFINAGGRLIRPGEASNTRNIKGSWSGKNISATTQPKRELEREDCQSRHTANKGAEAGGLPAAPPSKKGS